MNKTTLSILAGAILVATTGVSIAGGHGGGKGKGGHSMKRMMMYADLVDTNNDKTISQGEFLAFRTKYFAIGDGNNDGRLSVGEFQAMQEAIKADAEQARLQRRFNRMDENNDGVITDEEFEQVSSRQFIRMDRNDDGVVNKKDRSKHKR